MIANVSRLAHSTPAVALHKASPVTCYMVDITRHYIVHSVIHHYALCYVCAVSVLCVCVCVCAVCGHMLTMLRWAGSACAWGHRDGHQVDVLQL